MTITIKHLTVKNFLSSGNVTQSVNFDRSDLTLVLGENLDLGGDDNGSRNGVGKSLIGNALSYALFGQALANIKKDNLINKTNEKNMLVTLAFTCNGVNYRIERGRRPHVLSFYKENVVYDAKDNDAQGDSRETQHEIETLLGMTHDIFKHIVVMNTYVEPFLTLRANDQRIIIEQLLGITVLSEKAEALKEQIRQEKETIVSEEYKIKALIEANKKITEQITVLRQREAQWTKQYDLDIDRLANDLTLLNDIDIDSEISLHEKLKEFENYEKILAETATMFNRESSDKSREETAISKIEKELVLLANHKCHACGQDIHDDTHSVLMTTKSKMLDEHKINKQEHITNMNSLKEAIDELKVLLSTKPKHTPYYKTINEAFSHRTTVEKITHQLTVRANEVNPYSEQITDMEAESLLEIDYSTINNAAKVKEHQEFLLKLLTNKDSFIRKRIIDQNLTYLNARLSHYLTIVGLPHTVIFQNDLTVEISNLGQELDFWNLSRGEMTRVVISLSLAFRDVFECMFSNINLLFIDELLDSGIDSSGTDNSLGLLKKIARDSKKSIWLISHKDDIAPRVDNVFYVVKENGFTTFSE